MTMSLHFYQSSALIIAEQKDKLFKLIYDLQERKVIIIYIEN